ncbi:methanogen output domain 1-containing protein [Cerasicoccus frondis]|uniref:methanogen output domain 1-containing protein n=1 Tax=Cerasicoccus frondis TaxID=490090 RepID=UPI002852981B|nr:methanogen output domain 1-containing protein [Cerasicoccus frondis]
MPTLHNNQRDRDQFLRELVTEIATTLQDVVGMEEAEGFVKMVGLRLGQKINEDYTTAEDIGHWSMEDLANVLIDLKAKINGGFSVESIDEDKIVLVNSRCPFGELAVGRPSLCHLTSSVFGQVASSHFGYSSVEITESIARGDHRCRVIVALNPDVATQGSVHFHRGKV